MSNINFSAVDVFIVATVMVSFILGWIRGITKEILSIVSWILGIYLAVVLFPYVKDFARAHISHGLIADFATVCALFVFFLTILSALNYFCSNVVKKSVLNTPDKALGGIFGIIRAAVILGIIDLVVNQFITTAQPPWLSDSTLRPTISNISNVIILMLPDNIQDKLLAHMSQMKKQNLQNFIREYFMETIIPESTNNIARETQNAIASDKSNNKEIVDLDDLYNKTPENDFSLTPMNKQQTAEDLATLKPKKITSTPDKASTETVTKRGKLDLERILDQYDNTEKINE
jgi:membrane protein required for colicin V production